MADGKKRALTFNDGVYAVETAIAENYGLEYLSDSAQISLSDLSKIIRNVLENPEKYVFAEETKEEKEEPELD